MKKILLTSGGLKLVKAPEKPNPDWPKYKNDSKMWNDDWNEYTQVLQKAVDEGVFFRVRDAVHVQALLIEVNKIESLQLEQGKLYDVPDGYKAEIITHDTRYSTYATLKPKFTEKEIDNSPLSDSQKQYAKKHFLKSGDDNPVPEKPKQQCIWRGNLDACGNETCWDLQVCQGNPPLVESTPVIEQKEEQEPASKLCTYKGVLCYNPTCFLNSKCGDLITREGYYKWKINELELRIRTTIEPESKLLTPQVTDGYTREDVLKIVANCCNYFFSQGIKEGTPYSRGGDNDYVKWFEKNVPLPKPPQV